MQLSFFSPDVARDVRYKVFLGTRLGQFYSSLPLDELVTLLPRPKHHAGAPGYLTNKGKIALQFLKCYEGCSDEKLLERLNTNW
ncbi:MAG: DDE transposase, partial [Bacteroidota bacterium]